MTDTELSAKFFQLQRAENCVVMSRIGMDLRHVDLQGTDAASGTRMVPADASKRIKLVLCALASPV